MAVKTITIDMEAYEALKRRKLRGQSFSQVIKEHFGGGATGADLLALMDSLEPLSEETLDALDRIVESRRKSVPEVPKL
jgi:predicted CopG family antitoxin